MRYAEDLQVPVFWFFFFEPASSLPILWKLGRNKIANLGIRKLEYLKIFGVKVILESDEHLQGLQL